MISKCRKTVKLPKLLIKKKIINTVESIDKNNIIKENLKKDEKIEDFQKDPKNKISEKKLKKTKTIKKKIKSPRTLWVRRKKRV